MPEILAYVRRGGRRFIVVFFPDDWGYPGYEETFELIPDEPYYWRPTAIDRSLECAS